MQEFAACGLGYARVERIAERAGLAKRLVFYGFGDKEDLFRRALHESDRGIRDAAQALQLADLAPVEAMRTPIRFTSTDRLEHLESVAPLSSENLQQARHIAESSDLREVNMPLIETLVGVLERRRRAGVLQGDVDPAAARSLDRRATATCERDAVGDLDRDLRAGEALDERVSHIDDVVLGCLLR